MALHESVKENLGTVRKHLEDVSLRTSPKKSCISPNVTPDHGLKTTKVVQKLQLKEKEDSEFDPQLEPLLDGGANRFVIFPIHYPDIWDMYKKVEATFWTVQEVETEKDKKDWEEKLDDNQKHFILNVLAFCAVSNGSINKTVIERFSQDIKLPEARSFYIFQNTIEGVHSIMYSLHLKTCTSDPKEKVSLFTAIKTLPSMKKKINFTLKWIDHEGPNFPERVVALAAVKGIFLSSSFAAMFWLKKQGVMPGLTFSNDLISRDKELLCDFACLMFKHIVQKPSFERVKQIIQDAVVIEKEFLTEALPVNLIGMNSELVCKYIECVADRLFIALGYAKVYNSENPFPFMNVTSREVATNVFEKKITEYKKFGVAEEDSQKKNIQSAGVVFGVNF
ncbi:ribonucleoside-diphosphate reductase subunit M2 B-like [Pseudomyrmex gracilis]|uniref:ribonucleoside-diphosphate reductase subunit M2 B-like n=1 Tax=Pseudomyrmex gracilis TaxID=219809 RepID=UPI000995D992|nr:ribonucleoside-diphosphate reductase subunit M2 B-like [Pseudomyrmex gracilis]